MGQHAGRALTPLSLLGARQMTDFLYLKCTASGHVLTDCGECNLFNGFV